MPRWKDQAIVLRRWPWSETSQTALLLTREHGLSRGLAKGALRERGAFSGGFELLVRGEIVAIDRPSSDLALFVEWDAQRIVRAPRRALDAHHAALYLADLASRCVAVGDPHPGLFAALVRALEAMERGLAPVAAVLAAQWAALEETGRAPSLPAPEALAGSARRWAINPETGSISLLETVEDRRRVWPVRPATLHAMHAAQRAGWSVPLDASQLAPGSPFEDHTLQSSCAAVATLPPRAVQGANALLAALHLWARGEEPSAACRAFLARPLDVMRRLRRRTEG
ncbi:MAG: hypothetical protein D6824_08685 [Planctomycetota bacterium]|nr:MAG: hypothetical protein D6824_08685 [Planctomycetota bacterium]